jgi:hypothetical protein
VEEAPVGISVHQKKLESHLQGIPVRVEQDIIHLVVRLLREVHWHDRHYDSP